MSLVNNNNNMEDDNHHNKTFRPTGNTPHPGLTRVNSIRFLLFEIKRVLVFNSRIFQLRDLFMLFFFIQNVHSDKKVFK